MSLDPATDKVILCSSQSILLHMRREVVCAFLGMAASAAATFSCRIGGRQSRWEIVSRYHPRTVFRVDHAPYPCLGLFREMEYIRRRQATIAEKVACLPIYELYTKVERISGMSQMMRWWDQDVVNESED